MIVVDASVMADALLNIRNSSTAAARLVDAAGELHAPYLIDIEVAHVIRRHAAVGIVATERGQAALQVFAELPLTRYPHAHLLPRIWALRANLTAYDAAYVALAEALDAPLVTRDRRLAATPGHSARIEVV